jgi:hypothetical protein
MMERTTAHRALATLLALGMTLVGTRGALAQSSTPTPQQLDTLVAPIALYPDALVAHILPASTYPVEIVEAARALQDGGKPTDAEMNSWDPSIQALVQVPSVIKMMNDRLSWTTQLGQAVSANQQAVMDAIQRVREKAKQAGNLTSNAQQTVKTDGSTIIIEPTNPQVIYVPQYDPVAILEPAPLWATPGYGLMTFGAGFTAGFFTAYACHWGGGWGWGGGNSITVNNNYRWNSPNIKNSSINTNVSGNNSYKSWNAPKNVGHITNTYPGNNRGVDQGKLGGDQWGGRHDDGGFGDGGGRHGGWGAGDDGFRGMGGDGWGARDASDRGARSFGGDGFGGGGFGRHGGWGGGGWGGGDHGGGWGGGFGRGFGGGFGGGRGRR